MTNTESTAVMDEILMEFHNQRTKGWIGSLSNSLKFRRDAFSGISLWVASEPVGFDAAEITQMTGKRAKEIAIIATRILKTLMILRLPLTDDQMNFLDRPSDIF
jgi:hypothetical protein